MLVIHLQIQGRTVQIIKLLYVMTLTGKDAKKKK